MNRREALIDVGALMVSVFAGYYGGGLIQSNDTGKLPKPEEYKMRSGVFIRGEEEIITGRDHSLQAKVNEQVFKKALLLCAQLWRESEAIHVFLKAYPLRIALNVQGLPGLARYINTNITSEPELQFSQEFLELYYNRRSPNWGPPERVIVHELRHLVQDATNYLIRNRSNIRCSILSGFTTFGTLTGIQRGQRRLMESQVIEGDETETTRLIENGFWGGAMGLGVGFAAEMCIDPAEIDADIASTTALTNSDVANLKGSFFDYQRVP